MLAELLQKRGVYFDMIWTRAAPSAKSHLGRRSYPAALIGVAEKAVCVYKLTARVPAAQLGRAAAAYGGRRAVRSGLPHRSGRCRALRLA